MQTTIILALTGAIAMWLAFRVYLLLLFRPYDQVRFLGRTWQGIIPANQPFLARSIAAAVKKELLESDLLEGKLSNPDILNAILPEVEKHIDHFLEVKLKSALPVIGMFIGEKVTSQLKNLFMEELETLFPSVMSQIFAGLQHNPKLEEEISVKLQLVKTAELEKAFYNNARTAVNKSAAYFALAGFITGLVQGLFIQFLSR